MTQHRSLCQLLTLSLQLLMLLWIQVHATCAQPSGWKQKQGATMQASNIVEVKVLPPPSLRLPTIVYPELQKEDLPSTTTAKTVSAATAKPHFGAKKLKKILRRKKTPRQISTSVTKSVQVVYSVKGDVHEEGSSESQTVQKVAGESQVDKLTSLLVPDPAANLVHVGNRNKARKAERIPTIVPTDFPEEEDSAEPFYRLHKPPQRDEIPSVVPKAFPDDDEERPLKSFDFFPTVEPGVRYDQREATFRPSPKIQGPLEERTVLTTPKPLRAPVTTQPYRVDFSDDQYYTPPTAVAEAPLQQNRASGNYAGQDLVHTPILSPLRVEILKENAVVATPAPFRPSPPLPTAAFSEDSPLDDRLNFSAWRKLHEDQQQTLSPGHSEQAQPEQQKRFPFRHTDAKTPRFLPTKRTHTNDFRPFYPSPRAPETTVPSFIQPVTPASGLSHSRTPRKGPSGSPFSVLKHISTYSRPVDSWPSHEHIVDFGAASGRSGSFGWYADLPVSDRH